MTSFDLLDFFRAEVSDTAEPFLWTDVEALTYMNEAQVEFCRRTDGIIDSRTPSIVNLTIVPNVEWYATDPSILTIRSATRNDTGHPVKIMTAETAATEGLRFFAAHQGCVRTLVTGFDAHALRTHPMPNETVGITLSVYRLPLVTINDTADFAFEIDAQHVLNLTMWMKYRAYSKQDAETLDANKAKGFRDEFVAYCAQAKLEQARARRANGNIAYGGIQTEHRGAQRRDYRGGYWGSY